MLKKRIIFAILCILLGSFALGLSGCATAGKQESLAMQGLRNQISVLEAQIQTKDEEISDLRDALSKISEEKEAKTLEVASKKRTVAEVKSRPNARQIQIALKNAGFEPGLIDGKIGRQTRDAIKAFQKANNLLADGKVGKQTWGLLKEYLYKKIK